MAIIKVIVSVIIHVLIPECIFLNYLDLWKNLAKKDLQCTNEYMLCR